MVHRLVTCLTCATEYDLVNAAGGVLPLNACPRCGDVGWTPMGTPAADGAVPRPRLAMHLNLIPLFR